MVGEHGWLDDDAESVSYIREIGDDDFDMAIAPVERIAAMVPVTPQVIEDETFLQSYIEDAMPRLIENFMDTVVENAIVDAGAPVYHVRWYETTRRAIARSVSQVTKDGGLEPDVVWRAPDRVMVGAFNEACQVFRRRGVVIESTTANDGAFVVTGGMVMIRGETGAAVAVYRPSAFAVVHVRRRVVRPWIKRQRTRVRWWFARVGRRLRRT